MTDAEIWFHKCSEVVDLNPVYHAHERTPNAESGATSSTLNLTIVDGPDFTKTCANSTVPMTRSTAHTAMWAQPLF